MVRGLCETTFASTPFGSTSASSLISFRSKTILNSETPSAPPRSRPKLYSELTSPISLPLTALIDIRAQAIHGAEYRDRIGRIDRMFEDQLASDIEEAVEEGIIREMTVRPTGRIERIRRIELSVVAVGGTDPRDDVLSSMVRPRC
ncbi:hypothetical protein [Haladaptatus sp. DYF46]|uniref:hypothetical protein n=1 Tax=Haladaptatus sp. DYF46 TaxID=2886041 RepID=UPI001E564FF4|nr:hypothetical protein [Haladaptatus sp. DYF46]